MCLKDSYECTPPALFFGSLITDECAKVFNYVIMWLIFQHYLIEGVSSDLEYEWVSKRSAGCNIEDGTSKAEIVCLVVTGF